MATLIANCLARLVARGRITQPAADAAQRLHDGILGRLGETMAPSHAEAAAALEAARVMAEAARARKVSAARQAIAQNASLERVRAHPKRPAAGLMAEMTTDIHGRASGANIESLTEVLSAKMMGFFRAGAEAMRSRWAGLVQDRAVAERFIDELFGVSTGDEAAAAAAKGFREANEYGVARARQGGKVFTEAEDWRIPQDWESGRVATAGEKQWTADMLVAIDAGGLRVWSKETRAPAAPTDIPIILKQAYKDITLGTRGTARAFNREMRIFRFAEGEVGAKAWKALMFKYSSGRDIYGLATMHVQSMAREIAFVDLWGPEYRGTFKLLHDEARAAEIEGKRAPRILRWAESAAAAERTFRVLTGEANRVQSEAMAGIFGGIRSGLAAAQLGSAIVPSVFGDSVTATLAARWNGISGAQVVARAIRQMAGDSPELRRQLARMNLTAFAVSDSLVGSARYLDETFGMSLKLAVRGESTGPSPRRFNEVMAGAAQFVIRAQGLQAWTEAMKRAFSMEMLALVAEEAPRAFGKVSPEFRRFLTARGITEAEWNVIRATPAMEIDGARFFDLEGVADRSIGEKLMAAIIDERRYAVLEPSARVTQFTTQGLPRGTLMRELLGSGFAYKSFPIAMLLMHGGRLFAQIDEPLTRMTYFAKLAVLGTLAGAATVQVKAILAGKDPRPMDRPEFWIAASLQGGALGIFGDFLYQGISRGGAGLVGTLIGPIGGLVEQGGRFLFPNLRKAIDGEEIDVGAYGREVARFMRWNTPGTNLWFARLALDRLVWDQVQKLLDPNYAASFRRTEENAARDYGQRFWWGPGSTLPERAPDVGAMLQ